MRIVKTFWIAMCALLLAGSLSAGTAVEALSEKYEAAIKERIEEIPQPRQRLEAEYLMRQSYALHLAEEETRAVRSGAITTPEIETLREQRKALIQQMNQQIREIDQAILKAAKDAPVIQELQDVMKANEERIGALRAALMKDSQTQTPQAPNP